MKHLAILGSTGSIGKSALDIVKLHPDRFNVRVLTAASNVSLLCRQIETFEPDLVAVIDEQIAGLLAEHLKNRYCPEIVYGQEGYQDAAAYDQADTVLLAMVGAAGLLPALAAIDAKKKIALANKETLVMAGELVMQRARENQVDILPVDSEHSAIFQCLQGQQDKDMTRVFLTASGGPFRNTGQTAFKDLKPADALNHPTWDMGSKITIDSATLMNKGLEVIEAVHLFDLSPSQIEVVIHPQSIVHSMVGFRDGSIIAQMGEPDMKAAISYALSYPHRLDIQVQFPDFFALQSLRFEKPDTTRFPSLTFAFEACTKKGTLPAVMNAANEVAVSAFLGHTIGFPDIFSIISHCMEQHRLIDNPDLSSIIEADQWARETAVAMIES
ncbi:MAG: 1-deoxy-D-xylulose-5-phosphate reductoisomerase [Desulfobacteraceae bacterium]|nr:MAG: 1-deoxy-D-xylulose-5-phosphate reductoisomerase [Desulfobacteraceae bacterium]